MYISTFFFSHYRDQINNLLPFTYYLMILNMYKKLNLHLMVLLVNETQLKMIKKIHKS